MGPYDICIAPDKYFDHPTAPPAPPPFFVLLLLKGRDLRHPHDLDLHLEVPLVVPEPPDDHCPALHRVEEVPRLDAERHDAAGQVQRQQEAGAQRGSGGLTCCRGLEECYGELLACDEDRDVGLDLERD